MIKSYNERMILIYTKMPEKRTAVYEYVVDLAEM